MFAISVKIKFQEYIEKFKSIDLSKLLDVSIFPLVIAAAITIIAIFLLSRRRDFESGRSVKGWIVAHILLCIPIVSWVMLFIWAFGSKTRDDFTFRSWARLNLCIILFVVVYLASLVAIAMVK